MLMCPITKVPSPLLRSHHQPPTTIHPCHKSRPTAPRTAAATAEGVLPRPRHRQLHLLLLRPLLLQQQLLLQPPPPPPPLPHPRPRKSRRRALPTIRKRTGCKVLFCLRTIHRHCHHQSSRPPTATSRWWSTRARLAAPSAPSWTGKGWSDCQPVLDRVRSTASYVRVSRAWWTPRSTRSRFETNESPVR